MIPWERKFEISIDCLRWGHFGISEGILVFIYHAVYKVIFIEFFEDHEQQCLK